MPKLLLSPQNNAKTFTTTGNNFYGNSAFLGGGAWTALSITSINFSKATFINNTVNPGTPCPQLQLAAITDGRWGLSFGIQN